MTIEELYREYCARCVGHFLEARRTTDTDALHDFRVGVRRLKLLVGLLDSAGVGLWPKTRRRQVNRAFQAAGALRDIQTQLRLGTYWSRRLQSRYRSFRTMLTQLERDDRDRFETRVSEIPLDVLLTVTPDIDQKLRLVDLGRLKQLAQDQTADVPELLALAAHVDAETVHPLRIRIKKAKYILDVMHQLFDRTDESVLLREQLSRMQDRFGFWHDLQIHRGLIKAFLKTPNLTDQQIQRIVVLREAIVRVQASVLSGRFSIPSEFV